KPRFCHCLAQLGQPWPLCHKKDSLTHYSELNPDMVQIDDIDSATETVSIYLKLLKDPYQKLRVNSLSSGGHGGMKNMRKPVKS
ncbi:hypothetical protein AVEN_16931-1, partial [Araneus ventricosus]